MDQDQPGTSALDTSRRTLLNEMFSESVLSERKSEWESMFKKYETCSQYSTADVSVSELVEEIETNINQLRNEIRTLIFKRNESRFLEDGHFEEWNKKLFEATVNIRDEMTLDDLKAYVRRCLKKNIPTIKQKIEKKCKSTLKSKLLLRKENRKKGLETDNKLNSEISEEWKKLLEVVSLEDLVAYSFYVLKTHKGIKKHKKKRT